MRDNTDKPKLSPTEARAIKGKIKAELTDTSQAKIALEVFPHQTPGSAAVSMSTILRKPNVQEALQIALAEHNLTADRVIGVVDEAMGANKTITIGKDGDSFIDEVADHSIRLKAAGMAAQFMGLNKDDNVPQAVHFHNHQAKETEDYKL